MDGPTATSTDRGFRGCAAVGQDLGDDPAGTATASTGWLVVEHDGPWTPRAPTEAELGGALAVLEPRAAAADVRVQLARPVAAAGAPAPRRHARDRDAPRSVVLARCDARGGWARRVELASAADLADLPLDARADPGDGFGERVEDLWLVCAHARRDACCAVEGRPVADELARAGRRVVETTHLGGHRFAATVLHLPSGVQLARVPAGRATEVAEALDRGEVDPGLLRGRVGLSRPAQAGEVLDRRARGTTSLSSTVVQAVHDLGDGVHEVRLRDPGGDRTVRVRHEPTGVPRPVSDGAAATDPGRWVLVP